MAGREEIVDVAARSAKNGGRLIALEGVNGTSLRQSAKKLAGESNPRGAVSCWDASGIFDELAIIRTDDVGEPSMRTLLLLYAADLAFRLRWQIKPALAEGRVLIVAPYVDTAIALGRAAGIDRRWLRDLFAFAPKPSERHYIDASVANVGDSIVECACRYAGRIIPPRELVKRTKAYLGSSRKRASRRRPAVTRAAS